MGWDLMSTFPVDLTRVQMKFAGVDKLVLLPLDLTTQMKGWAVTNEEVRKMMDLAPDLFYGLPALTLTGRMLWKFWTMHLGT